MKSGLLTQDITRSECPYLPFNKLMKGTLLYEYRGPYAYGIIEDSYIAVTTAVEGKGFFQIDPRLILWSPKEID